MHKIQSKSLWRHLSVWQQVLNNFEDQNGLMIICPRHCYSEQLLLAIFEDFQKLQDVRTAMVTPRLITATDTVNYPMLWQSISSVLRVKTKVPPQDSVQFKNLLISTLRKKTRNLCSFFPRLVLEKNILHTLFYIFYRTFWMSAEQRPLILVLFVQTIFHFGLLNNTLEVLNQKSEI
jgi:hypothetical protein